MNVYRILVIDDEYGIRMGVKEILELEGYQVETAATGGEAVAIMEGQEFDAILIDYRLPDTDGISFMKLIREKNLDAGTCMITAYANIDTAIAATREGIDFFLPKPFCPEDLIGVVQTLCRHKEIRREKERLRLAHEAGLLALAEERSQTHSLVESLRDAVLVVNRADEVALINPAMAELLNRNQEEVLRKPVREILIGDGLAPVAKAVSGEGLGGRAAFETDLQGRQYLVGITPFSGPGQTVLGKIVTFADISAVRRMAMEKSRFVRTMVHELRSPLGAIKSIIEVIQDRSLGGEVEVYEHLLGRANKRLDALVELIGALLDLSRIEMTPQDSGRLELFDPQAIVTEVVELYRQPAAARGIEIKVEVDPALRVIAAADDLRTILTNVVANAVKYNRDGGSVTIKAVLSDKDANFTVEDTGLGIKEENLARIFDEFFREKRPETRSIDGNGLGLAIVKRLLDRYSGKITVSSIPGKGSTFRFYLPAGQAGALPVGEAAINSPSVAPEGSHVKVKQG